MNKTAFDNQWKPLPNGRKAGLGKVAGDNLGRRAGEFDKLVRVLQEKCGYSRERAAGELKRRLAKHTARAKVR